MKKLQALMKKLCYSFAAAKLRRLTPLCAVESMGTKWDFTYEMLLQFVKLSEFISKSDDEKVQCM